MQQCVGQQCLFMEEQLMMQQQQMEEDQRWLEQEERLLVTHTLKKKLQSGTILTSKQPIEVRCVCHCVHSVCIYCISVK